jgi:hypothetical protein
MLGEEARTEALPGSYAFAVNVSKPSMPPVLQSLRGTKSGFAQPAVGPLIITSAQEAQVKLDKHECRIPSVEVSRTPGTKSHFGGAIVAQLCSSLAVVFLETRLKRAGRGLADPCSL